MAVKKETTMNVRWVSQSNLGKHYHDEIEVACKNLRLDFIPQSVIPFSDILPEIDTNKLTIFYGATNWINVIYKSGIWTPGTFFNPDSILTHWIEKYKEHSLNYTCLITTLNQLKTLEDGFDLESALWENGMAFIRPVSDQKEFAGQVISLNELDNWSSKVMIDVPNFGSVPIIISKPVGISHEWRLFVVDGEISSGSHYRSYHELKIDKEVPQDIIDFAKERIKEYAPMPIFVMDIGKSGENLYVIEIGCFNSAGFYAADVEKIVYDVSKYVENNFSIFPKVSGNDNENERDKDPKS